MDVCAICAWRATCQKRFSISGKDMHCPDFAKDVALKEKTEEAKKKEQKKG